MSSARADGAASIAGTVEAPADVAARIESTDRLILKLYHPGPDGLEMDPKFRIFKQFELPLAFEIAPSLDMSKRSKHQAYVVQAFTDKDQDIESIVEGELTASSNALLPLGTRSITLNLSPVEVQ